MRLIVRQLSRKAGRGNAPLALGDLVKAIQTTHSASPILEFNQVHNT